MRWFALSDESCSSGIARTDIGNGHCCNRMRATQNQPSFVTIVYLASHAILQRSRMRIQLSCNAARYMVESELANLKNLMGSLKKRKKSKDCQAQAPQAHESAPA